MKGSKNISVLAYPVFSFGRKSANENDVSSSAPWMSVDGEIIDGDSPVSDIYISAEGSDAYFYLLRDKGGHTVYNVKMPSYVQFPASASHQFTDPADAREVCELLALGRLEVGKIKAAAEKNKGRNAAALILYTRNQIRSSSLVDYRQKMRNRQMPLKQMQQWKFFCKMIDDNQLTAAALRAVLEYANVVEAARNGVPANVPADWTEKAAQDRYIVESVEG